MRQFGGSFDCYCSIIIAFSRMDLTSRPSACFECNRPRRPDSRAADKCAPLPGSVFLLRMRGHFVVLQCEKLPASRIARFSDASTVMWDDGDVRTLPLSRRLGSLSWGMLHRENASCSWFLLLYFDGIFALQPCLSRMPSPKLLVATNGFYASY